MLPFAGREHLVFHQSPTEAASTLLLSAAASEPCRAHTAQTALPGTKNERSTLKRHIKSSLTFTSPWAQAESPSQLCSGTPSSSNTPWGWEQAQLSPMTDPAPPAAAHVLPTEIRPEYLQLPPPPSCNTSLPKEICHTLVGIPAAPICSLGCRKSEISLFTLRWDRGCWSRRPAQEHPRLLPSHVLGTESGAASPPGFQLLQRQRTWARNPGAAFNGVSDTQTLEPH